MAVDVPSLNPSGQLPVLDLELSIVKQKVQFIFFKKSVSNPRVKMYTSAISSRTKRDTLMQEGYRHIKNCSEDISDEVKNQILSKYMNTLRISG